ncbi:tRNA lysidine(34) synthetase TilS [Sphingobacterium deserti]|uniref:tRNA(Ile)-lysidine synthase n=1 Tax=Sphingobacterium deserti TaxID=1229276 RepID=A0A0B8T971_9SPHI|nr:tRNA lysidine(34) synthetase TilS [Sphingobacterium deserti]KGE15234.1 tRNA(Ile)-lysidine synthase [Sphingobacterium deserti]
MDLLYRFQKYLVESLSISEENRILLAVSGGRDSMLMAYLFIEAGLDCIIAHCNFNLRGAESDKDEELVREFAGAHGVSFFSHNFDTENYAKEKRISIQMAARELRYAWFAKLRLQERADWIAIAQHQNDHIETALLNLTRGTGLRGLRGILPKQGRLIRPLLFLSSAEVTAQVAKLSIPFRDDQSNFSTKYARNKMRLEVIPKLKEVNPDFETVMIDNITNFQESYQLLQSFISPIRENLFRSNGDYIEVYKTALASYIGNGSLLFELFRPFGFTKSVLRDLQDAWNGESGRYFQSSGYEMLLDRTLIRLRPLMDSKLKADTVQLHSDSVLINFDGRIFETKLDTDVSIIRENAIAKLDFDHLSFPLQIRYWKEGDIFHPLGMSGRQKVSDFFTQQKIDRYEKERIPLLINGNGDILWIVGYRIDNRYRITESTKKVFTLVYK